MVHEYSSISLSITVLSTLWLLITFQYALGAHLLPNLSVFQPSPKFEAMDRSKEVNKNKKRLTCPACMLKVTSRFSATKLGTLYKL